MRFILLMISLIVVLLFSCENKQYINTYSNRLDSLSNVLNETEKKFKSIDTAEVKTRLNVINQLLFNTDSLDNIIVTDSVKWIKSIKKGFEHFLSVYPTINNEITYTQSQLNGFEHDLEKGYLSEAKTMVYFEQENQSVRVIQLKADYYIKSIGLNNDQYQQLESILGSKLKNGTQ